MMNCMGLLNPKKFLKLLKFTDKVEIKPSQIDLKVKK